MKVWDRQQEARAPVQNEERTWGEGQKGGRRGCRVLGGSALRWEKWGGMTKCRVLEALGRVRGLKRNDTV